MSNRGPLRPVRAAGWQGGRQGARILQRGVLEVLCSLADGWGPGVAYASRSQANGTSAQGPQSGLLTILQRIGKTMMP